MAKQHDIEAIEKQLWQSADNLRANSSYASNEYFLPLMGLLFLRHASSRYLAVKDDIVASLPKRGGVVRPLAKEDFSSRSALFLRPEAQFDYLAALPEKVDLTQAISDAMKSIEDDYETLRGILPKDEYKQLDDKVLRSLLATFNDPALKTATGDVFGRIYEYFLTQFADQKAHDGGEFFTPAALVRMIVNVIEPDHGTILDPACGSGGMFVQSGHFIEQIRHENPSARVVFHGYEKNQTTINLAKMNLAVHGLEGEITKAITYYEDPHELLGKADFVMANPPFNVDEVDAAVKTDPRLPFGLPGVNKSKKVSNANYIWISFFYSYLNDTGRAGFVMSSQASSAGRDEAEVRRKLVETGAVDVMLDIRGNFFYTRTVPCQLWFLDKAKPEERRDKVLMIDARNVYRKVTRKIFDFSPEQIQNLSAIVWLYRGQPERFLELVAAYLARVPEEGQGAVEPMADFLGTVRELADAMRPFLKSQADDSPVAAPWENFLSELSLFERASSDFATEAATEEAFFDAAGKDNAGLREAAAHMEAFVASSRELSRQAEALFKLAGRVVEICEKDLGAKQNDLWPTREIGRLRKVSDFARKDAVEQLRLVRYFHKQAMWLQERFPDAALVDVPGLVKLVDRDTVASHDWSLTPGRYVGVAPEEVDDDFDFEEALREIHTELQGLNEEAAELAARIASNFEELGI